MKKSGNSKLALVTKILCRELRQKATDAEIIFWGQVRNRKYNNLKFYRQYPLFFDYNGKETFYIADFYCFEKQIVIEVDGDYHNSTSQIEKDRLRTYIINMLGIQVLRFSNKQIIEDLNNVLEILNYKITQPKPFS